MTKPIVISDEAKKAALERYQKFLSMPVKKEVSMSSTSSPTTPVVTPPPETVNDLAVKKLNFKVNPRLFDDDKPCKGCSVVAPLFLSGLCWDCDHKETEAKGSERRRAEAIGAVLGGPHVAAQFNFDNFVLLDGNKEAYGIAKAFNVYANNLFLTGETGTGKSHLLYAIAGECHMKGYTVIVKTVKGLRRDLGDRRFRGESAIIAELSNCEVLALDELGFGDDSQYVASQLCEILDNRVKFGRNGLIVTSNHTIDSLQTFFNDRRLTSRLYGMCQTLELTPKDKTGKMIDFRKYDLKGKK